MHVLSQMLRHNDLSPQGSKIPHLVIPIPHLGVPISQIFTTDLVCRHIGARPKAGKTGQPAAGAADAAEGPTSRRLTRLIPRHMLSSASDNLGTTTHHVLCCSYMSAMQEGHGTAYIALDSLLLVLWRIFLAGTAAHAEERLAGSLSYVHTHVWW